MLKNGYGGQLRNTKPLGNANAYGNSLRSKMVPYKPPKPITNWKQQQTPFDELNALNNRIDQIKAIYNQLNIKPPKPDNRNSIEKFLNLRQNQGFFGDTMELLSRPMSAIQSAIVGKEDSQNANNNFFENLWNGLSGKTQIGGARFWQDLTGKQITDPFLRFAAELGTDVFTDPLMLIPGEDIADAARLVGKGVKVAFKASQIPKVAKTAYETIPMVRKTVDYLKDVMYKPLKEGIKLKLNLQKDKNFLHFKDSEQELKNIVNHSSQSINTMLKHVHESTLKMVSKILEDDSTEAMATKKALTGKLNPTHQELYNGLTSELAHNIEGEKQLDGINALNRMQLNNGVERIPFIKEGLASKLLKDANETLGPDFSQISDLKKLNPEEMDKLLSKIPEAKNIVNYKNVLSDFVNKYIPELEDNKNIFRLETNGGNGLNMILNEKHVQALKNALKDIQDHRNIAKLFGKGNEFVHTLNGLKEGKLTLNINDPQQLHLLNQLKRISNNKLEIKPIAKDANGKKTLVQINGLKSRHWDAFLRDKSGNDFANFLREKYGTPQLREKNLQLKQINQSISKIVGTKTNNGVLDDIINNLKNKKYNPQNAITEAFTRVIGEKKEALQFLLKSDFTGFRDILKTTFPELTDEDIENLTNIIGKKNYNQALLQRNLEKSLQDYRAITLKNKNLINKKIIPIKITKDLDKEKALISTEFNKKLVKPFNRWKLSHNALNDDIIAYLHDPNNIEKVKELFDNKYIVNKKETNLWDAIVKNKLSEKYKDILGTKRINNLAKILKNNIEIYNRPLPNIERLNEVLKTNTKNIKTMIKDFKQAIVKREKNYRQSTNDILNAFQKIQHSSSDFMVSIGTYDDKVKQTLMDMMDQQKVISDLEKEVYTFKKSETLEEAMAKNTPLAAQLRATLLRGDVRYDQLVKNLTNVQQMIASVTKVAAGDDLVGYVKQIMNDGYLRHILTPNSFVFLALKNVKNDAERAKLVNQFRKLNTQSSFDFASKYMGTIKDINQSVWDEATNIRHLTEEQEEFKIFQTNPFKALAIQNKIEPQMFMGHQLFLNAIKSKMIVNFPKELTNDIESVMKEGKLNLTQAANKVLFNSKQWNEFKIIDSKVIKKLEKISTMLRVADNPEIDTKLFENNFDKYIRTLEGRGIIHTGVYNRLVNYIKITENNDGVSALMNLARTYTNIWKKTALFSIGFHTRNFLSNYVNAWTSGVGSVDIAKHMSKSLPLVIKLNNKIPKAMVDIIEEYGKKLPNDAASLSKVIREGMAKRDLAYEWDKYQEYVSNNIIGGTRFSADHIDFIRKLNKYKFVDHPTIGKGEKIKNAFDKAMQFNLHLTKISDDAWRSAMYEFGKTEKGMKLLKRDKIFDKNGNPSPSKFAIRVFFDYADTTQFENRFMKTIFPFYTWMRKNLELQVRNMINHPKKYIYINKVLQSMQTSISQTPDDLNQFTKEAMMIPVWQESNGNTTFIRMNLPFLDFDQLWNKPLNRLTPLIKLPLESLIGQNLFTGKKESKNLGLNWFHSLFWDKQGMDSFLNMNKPTSANDLGIIGRRLNDIFDPLLKVFGQKNGIQSIADILPTVFKTNDVMRNRINATKERLFIYTKYLQALHKKGVNVPTFNELPQAYRRVPRFRKTISNKYTGGSFRYKI